MFRASPWVSYQPTGNIGTRDHSTDHWNNSDNLAHITAQDIDMDAPQISTLREEETPPPPRTIATKFRVKLIIHEEAPGEKESEEEEEEEDQLIDDDDGDGARPSIPTPAPLVIPGGRVPKRGARGGGGVKKRGGRTGAPAPDPGPMMTWFEVGHSGSPGSRQTPQRDPWDAGSIGTIPPISTPNPLKKKAAPRKTALRKTVTKASKGVPMIHMDDAGSISEAFTGTAPSSPTLRDANTPETEFGAPSTSTHLIPPLDLNSVPLPVYPLPGKPFVVQSLPKIGSGFAPFVPLDKSGRKVRHWRMANREIRGIAGGRWFARSWVGDKESEVMIATFAQAEREKEKLVTAASTSAAGPGSTSSLALPKLSAVSISAGVGTGKSSSKLKFNVKAEQSSTAASSRSASVIPDVQIPRPPSKMRTSVAAPDMEEIIDVDMEPPLFR